MLVNLLARKEVIAMIVMASKIGSAVAKYFLELPAEIYASLFIMLCIAVFSIIIGSKMKKAAPFWRKIAKRGSIL